MLRAGSPVGRRGALTRPPGTASLHRRQSPMRSVHRRAPARAGASARARSPP